MYNILWVEDSEDWAASIEDSIMEILEEYGFEFSKNLISGEEEGIDYNAYDLILMDYNLNNTTGDKIIKDIRDINILTDVVFYSEVSSSELKNKVAEKDLEGVYYANRQRTQFIEKVKRVILSTIKKVQDLNNLRGLVMAEVSELDAQMDMIIKTYYSLPDKIAVFHEHITKDRESSLKRMMNNAECNKECTLMWRNLPLEDIINRIDSSQRAHAVHEILKDKDSNNAQFKLDNFFKNYDDRIISVRNNLAHCESCKEDGREVLKTRKGDKTFNSENFKAIRKDIITYHNKFNELLKYVNSI